MPLFTSSREKRLWLYTFLVLLAIASTLIFQSSFFLQIINNQVILAAGVMLSLILVGATIIIHGLRTRPGKTEITIWLGLIAVYILLFVRLGHQERTHLMEYSVLAIFIHLALIERGRQGNQILKPALIAFVATLLIGVLDECIQLFLPSRRYDPIDILFNGLAALMAIGSSLVLQWARKNISKN